MIKQEIKARIILATMIFGTTVLFIIGVGNYNELAKECDQAKERTCTHYEIRQFDIRRA